MTRAEIEQRIEELTLERYSVPACYTLEDLSHPRVQDLLFDKYWLLDRHIARFKRMLAEVADGKD